MSERGKRASFNVANEMSDMVERSGTAEIQCCWLLGLQFPYEASKELNAIAG